MLYLYKGILPNRNKQAYYFKNFDNYKTFLSTYLLKTINNDKYTINTDVLRVAIDEVLTPALLDEISYIIDEEGDYKRCYYVNSFNYQSGFAYLSLRIDIWGSYIYKASYSDIYIKESTGIYKYGLSNAFTYPFYYKDFSNVFASGFGSGAPYDISYINQEQQINNDEVVAVFSVKHNIYQTQDGAVSIIELIAISLRDLKTAWTNAGTSEANKIALSKYHDLEVVNRVLSGIYGASYTQAGAESFKAEILNAWLIPSWWLNTQIKDSIYIASRTGDSRNNSKLIYKCDILIPSIEVENVTINTQYFAREYTNIVGPFGNGILLKNTDKLKISYRITFSTEGINVVIGQGNNEKDITSSFAIAITHNAGDITPQREMATALNKGISLLGGGLSAIGGIVAGIATYNPLAVMGGLMAGAKTATGLIDEELNKMTGQQVGSGSGFASFYLYQSFGNDYIDNCKQPLNSPFVIVSFYTAYKANYEDSAGIYDNLYFYDNSSLFFHNANNELTGYQSSYNLQLYLKCRCTVNNVNEEGASEIENRLLSGLTLFNIDTYINENS